MMKAVILVAGEGKRLRPLTLTRPKHLLPIMNKPLLEYTIEALKDAGFKEFILVIGYNKEAIQNYFKDGRHWDIKIDYISQDDRLGTAHAAGMVEDHVDNDFLLMYGDIIVKKITFIRLLEKYNETNNSAIISLIEVEDPKNYGIIKLKNGNAKKIVEKPTDPTLGNLANAGIYILKPSIFEMIKKTEKSKRGEYELTDSIQMLIDKGEILTGFKIHDWWLDIGRPWDLLEANNLLMDEIEYKIEGKIEPGAQLRGKVSIGKGTLIRSNSYIKGPVIIGKNCDIGPNCYLRGSTSIGDNVRIGNACEIKGSVIMNRTKISHLSYIGDSIIGENVNLGAGTIAANLRMDDETIKVTIKGERIDSKRRKLGVIMGDNSQSGIGVTFMPGVIVGKNSAIAANINVDKDVPSDTLLLFEHKLIYKEWPLRKPRDE